jgi:hypothetical protein
MADFTARWGKEISVQTKADQVVEQLVEGPTGGLIVFGRENTYSVMRDGNDAIASIGFVSRLGDASMRQTLLEILRSFQEAEICNLKKDLLGQYVLLVKKGSSIFIFGDVIGGRNVFYSENDAVASSSFSLVEDLIGVTQNDLEMQKVLEYLALRHVLYPTWLGRTTAHRRIRWLLPYEYLVIDFSSKRTRVGLTAYTLQNRKESKLSLLSRELLTTLGPIVRQEEFASAPVAATLTGGHDSRLVAGLAADYYRSMRFRIAISAQNPRSLQDKKVAEKVSRVRGIPLDIYAFKTGRDEERFREQTEGFSPLYNHIMAPLVDAAGVYSIGFGGAFGTELFMPIPWDSIEQFIQESVRQTKKALVAGEEVWAALDSSLRNQFREIKEHYLLTDPDDHDYIRLFCLLVTARYGSFILSAFNARGYQLDPYGNYRVLELALRVSPSLWGNHKRFGGNGLVQKGAMGLLQGRMGRVFTYMHARPMLPLSISTFPLYSIGFVIQASRWLRSKFENSEKGIRTTLLPGAQYSSDGWEGSFLSRIAEKYDLHIGLPAGMGHSSVR